MKTFNKIIILSILSFTLSSASPVDTNIDNVYSSLSTAELEKKVESLSKSGDLPFLMGIELIKRWSNKA